MPVEEHRGDEPWRVDWPNACVWQGDAMVHLPPKALAILRLLMEQAGQLVTKAALLEAVWPEAVVHEAALSVCMSELRKALRDSAQTPRFIQTVHRRGYRFIGHLLTVAPSTLPPVPLSPPRSASPAPLLVGREREVTQLHQWLERVRHGGRQTVFLTGEPGMGKTAVVNAFVQEVASAGDVWLARGQCIEHYGGGEAYLPVLEALGRLCREPGGAPLLALLEQQAPTWLVQMPALLSPAAFEVVQRRVLGATGERMLREFAEAVEALTRIRPLVLILEDLHWSDYATMDLLTYLARRSGTARFLLLGTYRPVEVLLHSHPLQMVKQELVLHDQGVELPLGLLTATEVTRYLARRFAGETALPSSFRELALVMHQRTDGHPLFLVTVVEHLLQRGVLREDSGQWEVQPEAAAAALEVPASVRQMIEQQLARLSPEEQRVLEAASVAGSACAVAAVAAGLEVDLEAVEDCCTSLAQRSQFLVPSGLETWPDGTVAERYRWEHAVYQEVVYMRVPMGRRLRLHRRIGAREEAGYGEQAGEHAAELAMHFERGQDTARAVQYMQQAAENALRRYAYQEVVGHLTRGLALLATLPETAARAQQELDLQLTLGPALTATKGHAAPEVEQTYTRAQVLCTEVGDTPRLFPMLRGLWRFYRTRGALLTARGLGEQLYELAQQRMAEPTHLLEAHDVLGSTLFFLGEYAAAWTHLAQAITLTNPMAQQTLALRHGEAPGVRCLALGALTLWCLGYPVQAVQRSQEALALAQTLAHPYSLAFAESYAAYLHHRRREASAVQEQAEALLTLGTVQGFPLWVGMGTCLRGWVLAAQGQSERGLVQLRQGLTAVLATGQTLSRPLHLVLLAEVAVLAGQVEEGLRLLTEAVAACEANERGDLLAEAYRLQGACFLRQADAAQAEACFQQALDVARQQQAKSWELRAATSLARLWQQQGKRAEAYELLAPVYGWFTEGFDTADLQEAKVLLDELGA